MVQRISWLLVAAALIGLAVGARISSGILAATPTFSVSYTGTDYYFPSDYFTGCGNWTWLTSCYSNSSAGTTAQQLVASDASWIANNRMGGFQRVWVCLDELMYWDATNGYQGFNPQYLANLDDALARFHQSGIKVDLVLYEASKGTSDQYQFHTEALDGNHATMRAGYLQALRDFVNHLAANPTDTATVAVMDLFNEAYWQLEQFGYSDSVIHQWLQDEYNAAHGAQPGFNYTVSDTTRLLKDYATWNAMYPVDVYDIHVYDDAPWNDPGLYAAGKTLQKPWFSGEAGCASGNVNCTYQGNSQCTQPSTCALSVDTWWLNNLKADGAQAVLVEERNTAWSYASGPNSQTPTLVGQAIQSTTPSNSAVPAPATIPAATSTAASGAAAAPSGATFSNSFDDQSTGALVTGTGANQFSGTSGSSNLSVENTVVSSPPNALAVAVVGGGMAYADKQYSSAYTNYDLTFNLQLGTDFTLPSSEWLDLAQTAPSASSNGGVVDVTLQGGNRIGLNYSDGTGQQQSLPGSYVLPTGGWHTVELRESVGAGSGSLVLLVDGNAVAGGSNLALGTQGVTWMAVGDRYTPPDSSTAGHLYIDDVTAAAGAASAAANTLASSPATPPPATIPVATATLGPESNTPATTATLGPEGNSPAATATLGPEGGQGGIPAATATLAPVAATPATTTVTTSTPAFSTTAAPGGATFSTGFDDQSTGGLVTGSGVNQFTGTGGYTSLRVQNTVVSSPPNALAVTLDGGGRAYAYKQYSGAYTNYDLTFNLQLGTDFTLGSDSDYVNLAQTVPSTTSNAGKVTVVLPGDGKIRLDYFDSAGQQHYLWGRYVLPAGDWHTVEVRETMGAGSGSLALLVDGNTVAGGRNLDLGTQGLTWLAVGNKYSPPDSGTSGHLYLDDVTAADLAAPAPANTLASSPATPIATISAAGILPPAATQVSAATATPVPPSDTSVLAPTNTAAPAPTDTAVPAPTDTPVPVPASTSMPAPAGAAVPMSTSAPAAASSKAIKTVFLIVMENHNWSSIQGSSSAPYINSLLAGANDSQTSYATQYYNPPGNHPSLPNYLWLEAGTNFGIADDNPPSSHPLNTTSHLVALLDKAGISWKAYQEGIGDGTCPVSASYPYAPKHNPFVYFTDVNGNSAYCTAHERSYADLAGDLATNTVARYNFITPNLCDDMHDSCSPTNDAVKQGDSWLASNLPAILNSQAYKNGGAVFITWDEAGSGDGPIGLIVLSPAARGHGYHNAIAYTHSSTLRTLEEIYGVGPLLGDAQHATDLSDLFTAFP